MRTTGENYTAARAAMLRETPAPQAMSSGDTRFYDKTVATFFDGQRLRAIPAKRRARTVVLLELVRRLDPKRRYSEREISDVLAEAHPDFAWLRRELVDYGYLSRDANSFWVSITLPERSASESQEVPAVERSVFVALHEGAAK
ncbi:DUF2087 domain-containing protein [Epidermidibacterium keratini]|nr:DUF2087 domain-containing protein [Epidermidibacterium keratini]